MTMAHAGSSDIQPEHEKREVPVDRARPLGAFEYRDFRLIWFGFLISTIGYWMQFTSLTYFLGVTLAHSASQSALNLAFLGAARSLPSLVLAPIAGFVADRYPRRRTLFYTNAAQALLALALTVVSYMRGPWGLPLTLLIAGLFASAQAFDNPARQSWVTLLVPRRLFSNAIGLMSFGGNVPLLIGPALAGVVIATVNVSASFLFQAVTQWSVVAAVILMRPAPPSGKTHEPMLAQIIDGFRFIASHAALRWIVAMLGVTCLCVRPYTWLLAGFAAHVLHVGVQAYGLMLAVGGIGIIAGALTTAIGKPTKRARVWFVSGVVCASGMIAISFLHNFFVALALLTIMGWGTMSFISSTNVMLQTLSPEAMRGRSMGVYNMMQNGLIPVGTVLLGWLGSFSSLEAAYATGGAVALASGIWVWLTHPAVRRAQ